MQSCISPRRRSKYAVQALETVAKNPTKKFALPHRECLGDARTLAANDGKLADDVHQVASMRS